MQDSDELQTIVGQLDIFDGLDGQKLTVTTADGDEYLISSKKWIKRLNKYADENIDISFEGTVEHDPEEGMDVINIKSFTPAQEVDDDLPTLLSLNEDLKLQKDKHAKKPLPQDDDDIEPLDEDDMQDGLPWDKNGTESEDAPDGEDGAEDEDAEPNLEDLVDEDIPDDINLDDLEEEPPAPPAQPAKGKKGKR